MLSQFLANRCYLDLVLQPAQLFNREEMVVSGVGIGSTRKRVEEEFGEAEEVQADGDRWYWKKGIEFNYDADAKVKSIYVFKPVGAAPAGSDNVLQHKQGSEHKAILERYYSTE